MPSPATTPAIHLPLATHGAGRSRLWAVWLLPSLALALACGGGDTPGEVVTGSPSVRVVGGGASDTVDATLATPLTVEVRSAGGAAVTGVGVTFDAGNTLRGDPALYLCAVSASDCSLGGEGFRRLVVQTDAAGRAQVRMHLSVTAMTTTVRIAVGSVGYLDSVPLTVLPGQAVRTRFTPTDTVLLVGGHATLAVALEDRHGNRRPDTAAWTTGSGSAATLAAGTSQVIARAVGGQWFVARVGVRTDSVYVGVVPEGRIVAWYQSAGQSLQLLNLDGTGVRTILAFGPAPLTGALPRFGALHSRVTLTPDGVSIGVMDTLGVLVRSVGPAVHRAQEVRVIRETASGQLLVVAKAAGTGLTGGWFVGQVEADGHVTPIGALPEFRDYRNGAADITPDGTHVVYMAEGSSVSGVELRVLNLATGARTVIAKDGFAPRWAPTGTRLVYLATPNPATGWGAPTIVNADGTGQQRFTAVYLRPGVAWSPDGAYLLGGTPARDGLRLVRVSDGADVLLRFRAGAGVVVNTMLYTEPDWR